MKTLESFIRPSSTDENALCSGRPRMQAHVVNIFGEQEESPEASVGKNAHHWGELGIRLLTIDGDTCEELEEIKPVEEALAELRASHEKAVDYTKVDGWTWNVVEKYVRFIHALIVKHDIKSENVLVEEKLDMADLGFINKGTSDCLLIIPYELVIVIDLKAGFLEQDEAADHGQAAAYGCAAATRFKAKRVEVWIAQPRQDKDNQFSGAVFNMDAMKDASDWIIKVNEDCRAPNPPLKAGYKQCINCRALAHCPESKGFIMNTLEAIDMLGSGTLDPDGWGNAVSAAKLAKKQADVLCDDAKNHLKVGGEVTGFKLGAPRAMKSVNASQAMLRFEAAGVSMIEVAQDEAISVKIGSLKKPHYDLISDIITEKLSEPSLVADKRGGK